METYFAIKPQPEILERIIYDPQYDPNKVQYDPNKVRSVISKVVMIGNSTLSDISARLLGHVVREFNTRREQYDISEMRIDTSQIGRSEKVEDFIQRLKSFESRELGPRISPEVIEDRIEHRVMMDKLKYGLLSEEKTRLFLPRNPSILTNLTNLNGLNTHEINNRFVLGNGELYFKDYRVFSPKSIRFKLNKFGVDLKRFEDDEHYRNAVFNHPELVCHIVGKIIYDDLFSYEEDPLLEELEFVYGNPKLPSHKIIGDHFLGSDEGIGYIKSHHKKNVAPLLEL